jgi:hypothetical protein
MNRHLHSLLAAAGVILLVTGAAAGQAPATGTTKPRLVAPVRGVAQVNYTKPVVKRGKQDGREVITTTFQVKSAATAPIARFTVEEFWYDKGGNPVSGDRFVYPKPLQPGEVITITLNTPVNPKMDRNSYKFSHANGDIKPTVAAKL